MTAIPCETSYPAAAKLCCEKLYTYVTIPAVDKDGNKILTVSINRTEPEGDAAVKLMADASETTFSGKSWVSWANKAGT